MKIGIMHLSDLHISKFTEIDTFTDRIVTILNHYENIDEIMIVISGDITFSGKDYEFRNARKIIGSIQAKVGKHLDKYVNLIVVPGNHDLNLIGNCRKDEDIDTYYKKNTIDDMIEPELDMMSGFFDYAASKKLFNDSKIVSIKEINFSDLTIKFNLINTAIFSTLKHRDTGHHYLPIDQINKISRDGANYVFSVMHHPAHCFHDNSRTALEEALLNSSEIIFQGHEHNDKFKQEKIDKKNQVISNGGEIDFYCRKADFNFLTLDTSKNYYSLDKFEYVINDNIFKRSEIEKNKHLEQKKELMVSPEYMDSFYKDYTLNIPNFSDYFVFPKLTLENKSVGESTNITELDELLKVISQERLVFIKSKPGIGKTTLLKYLFKNYKDSGYPLFIDGEMIEKGKLEDIWKREIKNQYKGTNNCLDKFIQQDNRDKVVLIDNIHLINFNIDVKKVYEYFLSKFNFVIVSVNDADWLDLEHKFKEDYMNDYITIKLLPFVYSTRGNLVDNISCILNEEDKIKINSVKNTINLAYSNLNYLSNSSTDFLVRYIKYIIKDDKFEELQYENVFSVVFDNELYEMVSNNCKKSEIEEYLYLLSLIAKKMHESKQYFLGNTIISTIIDEYNVDFQKNINFTRFVISVCNAKILKESNNQYQFGNKMYLAYFVAKYVAEACANSEMEPFAEILNKICFGINSDIILFVSYFTKNRNIIYLINDATVELMKDWEKINFDDMNINYFNKSKQIDVKKLTAIDKKKVGDQRDKEELAVAERSQIECENVFDYDEEINTYKNNIVRSLKYTELIAKIIPTFHTLLKADYRTDMANELFGYVSKVVYYILKPIDEDFENIVSDLAALSGDEDFENRKENIQDALINFSRAIVLSIYDNIANITSNSKSSPILSKVESTTNSDKLFKLLILESLGNEDKLLDQISEMSRDNNTEINNMIFLVIRKHILTNDLPRSTELSLTHELSKSLHISERNLNKVLLTGKFKRISTNK